MRVALLGKGKTGSKVLELLNPSETVVFDQKNNPTFEKLQNCDVIISFLPGEVFLNLIPLLIEVKKPVVTGSTGFTWPKDIDQTLTEKKLSWIYGTNFSLGMVVVKQLIEKLHQVDHILNHRNFTLHEIHHTKKLDAPSGTALSMKEWLHEPCEISSERTGDVIGHHALTLNTGSEKITITHEALDRKLFAEGAVWAGSLLFKNKIKPGLHAFGHVAQLELTL